MLLAGCSTVCTTVAEAAKMWNLVVVSPGKHLYTTHFLSMSFFACFVSFLPHSALSSVVVAIFTVTVSGVSRFSFSPQSLQPTRLNVCVHVVNEFLNISRSLDVLKWYPELALQYFLVSFPSWTYRRLVAVEKVCSHTNSIQDILHSWVVLETLFLTNCDWSHSPPTHSAFSPTVLRFA